MTTVATPEAAGSARRRSSLGAGGELTPHAVQILRAGLPRDRRVVVQVLGVHRYMTDPVATRALPTALASAAERDLFDVVVSDGQMKLKCVLAPTLNSRVWRSQLAPLDLVEVTAMELVHVSPQAARAVVVLTELERLAPTTSSVMATAETGVATPTRPSKIVYDPVERTTTPSPTAPTSRELPTIPFVSTADPREHGALPAIGQRLYYLAPHADDHPLDWEQLDEPLTPVSTDPATAWLAWNRRRRYCTDIFHPTHRVVHTIREVNVLTAKRKRTSDDKDPPLLTPPPPPPPMLGVVHFKSQLMHLGTPELANPFPFMFHVVLSDRDRSVEVAFFGSMAARHFLTVQEGDVVLLRGYEVARSAPSADQTRPRKLFVMTHLSEGTVSHVPEKYWRLLEATGVLPERAASAHDDGERGEDEARIWLEPTFLTTLDVQSWDANAREDHDAMYFDFVGVVSYVGRQQRVRLSEDRGSLTAGVTLFRWIKVVDRSSSTEMVVRLGQTSQPMAFRVIQAGDTVMLTKLMWFDARTGPDLVGLEYATTSVYSTIRLNADVEPFAVFEDCAINEYFAQNLRKSCRIAYEFSEAPETAVSTFVGRDMAPYHPRHVMPTDVVAFTEAFGPKHVPFSQLEQICDAMEAMEHQHVLVSAALLDMNNQRREVIELVLGDPHGDATTPTQGQKMHVAVRLNPLLHNPVPPTLEDVVTAAAQPVLCLLPPSVIDELVAVVTLRNSNRPRHNPERLSLRHLKEHLCGKKQDGHRVMTFSIQLARSPVGAVDRSVDAIVE